MSDFPISRKQYLLIIILFPVIVVNAQSRGYLDSLFNEFTGIKNSGTKNTLLQSSLPGYYTKCGLRVCGEIKAYLNLYDKDKQKIINGLLDRPVLNESIVSPSGKFRIHYNKSGDGVPAYDQNLSIEENANLAALAIDSAYRFEVEYLGYLPPPGDYGMGGDDLYDIYITDLGYRNYGLTQNESYIEGNTWSSYIQIENDFAGCNTTGVNALEVTSAHELFHAIQMGNYFYDPLQYYYFYEMTATAMEDFVFDDVNDYYYYKEYFQNPSKPLYTYSANGAYSLAVWPIFLKERFDYNIIKRQWELLKYNHPLKAIDISLQEYSTSFKSELNEFGLWSYYTGERKSRAKSDKVFEEGEYYPELRIPYPIELTKSMSSFQQLIEPLSNEFFHFVSKITPGYSDTIISIITNADIENAVNNPGFESIFQYDLYTYKVNDSKQISDQLFSKLTSRTPEFYTESNIINNEIHHFIEEIDFAFPVPFSYNDNGQSLYLPVPAVSNGVNTADIKIFSISMNLIYSGKKEISQKNNKFIVSWDALDIYHNKLSTGVYIFVTETSGQIKTGKLFIKNE